MSEILNILQEAQLFGDQGDDTGMLQGGVTGKVVVDIVVCNFGKRTTIYNKKIKI